MKKILCGLSPVHLAGVLVATIILCLYCYRSEFKPPRDHDEWFVSGDVVGFAVDPTVDQELLVALDKLMESAQWLACVPAIQLEKIALAQSNTGITTIKAYDFMTAMKTRKNALMAELKRMPYSTDFKAGLMRYADYVLTAFGDIVKEYTDPDGFVNLKAVANAMSELRGGYCANLTTNFGVGNSFLPATA
jgi:hypothetical protein